MERYNARAMYNAREGHCINDDVMRVEENGEYVWYDDVKAELDAKDAEIQRLQHELEWRKKGYDKTTGENVEYLTMKTL